VGPGGPGGGFTAIDTTQYSLAAAFGHGATAARPAAIDPVAKVFVTTSSPGFTAIQAVPASQVHLTYQDYIKVFGWQPFPSLVGTPNDAVAGSRLEAMDLTTGKMLWYVDHLASANVPGALSNAFSSGVLITPGLVWVNSAQQLQAYSEASGQLLWSSPTLPEVMKAPPMAYLVNGKEYVADLGLKGDLYAFSL
jgi:glucose dehydrogenase